MNIQNYINENKEIGSLLHKLLNASSNNFEELNQFLQADNVPFITQSKVESMLKTENSLEMIFCLLLKQNKINENCFLNRNGLTQIVMPPSIKSIGNNAFNGCTNLIQVIIPQTVTFIGSNAFLNCKSL